jgi:Tol biopolymer transport system component
MYRAWLMTVATLTTVSIASPPESVERAQSSPATIREGLAVTRHVSRNGRAMATAEIRTGDLVVYDATNGSELFRLRDHPPEEFAWEPTLSYDGRWVAFMWLNDRASYDIRVVEVGNRESLRVVFTSAETREVRPLGWSPDNRRLLLAAQYWTRANELLEISIADGTRRTLWSDADRVVFGSCYLGSETVAFAATTGRGVTPGELRVLGVPTAQHVALYGDVAYGSAVYCLGNQRVAFVANGAQRRSLVSMTTNQMPKTEPRPLLQASFLNPANVLAVTDDGQVYTQQSVPARRAISVASLKDAGVAEPEEASGPDDPAPSDPVWSPDGSTLAFQSRRAGKSVVVLRRGLATTTIDTEALSGPMVWFPDNRSLLAASAGPQGVTFSRIDTQTGRSQSIHTASLQTHRQASLSSDGKFLFYVSRDNQANRMRLHRCRVEDGKCEIVLEATIPPAWPSWSISPTGKHFAVIAYHDDNVRAGSILIFDLASKKMREVFRAKPWLDATKFNGIKWSSDERWLYFVKAKHQTGSEQTLMRVPVAGGVAQSMGFSLPWLRNLALHPSGLQLAFQSSFDDIRERVLVHKAAIE